jgi:large subunit ribosomal protein L21
MFAVIKTGGKQYKVAKDDVIRVEKLPGDAGQAVEFAEVLLLGGEAGATVGTPLVDGATVKATVLEQIRDDKIIVFKKKRRKKYRRTAGHRQSLTVLRVTDIVKAAKKAAAKPADKVEAEEDKPTKKPAAKKTAAKKPAAKKPAAKKTEDND